MGQQQFIHRLIMWPIAFSAMLFCSSTFGQNNSQESCKPTPTFEEQLTHQELCRYGDSCEKPSFEGKQIAYCGANTLSQCFEQKAWQREQSWFELPPKAEVTRRSRNFSSKNGVITDTTCVIYLGPSFI